ncbi:carbohydrate kinase family protein [Candidatus Dojkabacteria bacterium]|uniref:Carbohydrate kinase family protein n=1 Tax=Candidatus Dojkabacteria bacterium TaxID=2099670 RepID=A0A955I7U7_9BACT|nr:carbohydrate kinase family protein [Candidatus Dojkabacteria bacterium]
MFDFVVIGDIIVDRIVKITDPKIISTIDTKEHTVMFPYPAKRQLDMAPETHAGGNAYNAATAIRKLGLNTAMFTVVGNDHEGSKMIEDIKALGVDCSLVQVDGENTTNSSVIMSINGDRVLFSYHHKRTYTLPQLPETKYVYLTSIGEDDAPLFHSVVEQKQKMGFKLVFSPGTLQIEESFADIKEVMQHTDVLILNKQEAVSLSRLNTESNENLLRGLHNFGPKQVVITRSERGSVASTGSEIIKQGALQVATVECTGAGDAYSSTLAAALCMNESLQTAMSWGTINSASVIGTIGATNGLLSLGEIKQQLEQKKDQFVYTEATSSEVGVPRHSVKPE